jgi:hypothetical protein
MRPTTSIVAALTLALAAASVPASAQNAGTPPAMSAADANDLIHRRCVVCHNAAKPLGGLNFELFDAATPDPAVALMMSIKVSEDGALFAAGRPVPDRETIDAFVRFMRASADPRAAGPWTIDLQADPTTHNGHHWVVAERRSDAGVVRLACNGKIRQFEATPARPRPDFDGLSPILRGVFTWCLEGSPSPAEAAK